VLIEDFYFPREDFWNLRTEYFENNEAITLPMAERLVAVIFSD
jgi:hypothetical protein